MQRLLSEAIAAFQAGQLDRARQLARQELADNPSSPQLQHLMGLIECRSGEPKLGIKWLRGAANAEPDNIAFRVMLVRALVDAGKANEALESASPPSRREPAEPALWHARAEAADAADKPEIAAEAWQSLCSARPDDWRAWANLGEALARLERWAEAAGALRCAWNLNRSEFPLQQKFATALAWAGRYDESAEQLRQLLDARPEDVRIRLTLARLYGDLGRNQDAVEQLDKAARYAVGDSASATGNVNLVRIVLPHRDPSAAISKQEVQAVRELALLLERTSRMDALRNLLIGAEELGIARDRLGYAAAAVALRDGNGAEAKRLLELEDSEDDRVRWHRLMSKIQDILGDCEGAFAAANVMNRSVRDFDGWVRRGAEYRRRLRNYENSITPDWAARLRPLKPSKRRPPAFLVGFPRSGTTLLDTFLMGHPDTEVVEEFHMLGAAETVLGEAADLPSRTNAELEQARNAYYTELDRHADPRLSKLIIDKLPLNILGLPVIYSLFPDSKVIFAQRHPCDAVLSGFMQSFALNEAMACFLTIEDAADLYDVAMGVFSRASDVLPIATQKLVYEELVAEPEAALRPLIEFLGLDWRPALLDHRSTAHSRGAIITPSYDQVVQPLNKSPSGRWRRYEKQLAPVLPGLLPWAERLGYSD
jgi:tetratricopeptide (TPR) repeat protein